MPTTTLLCCAVLCCVVEMYVCVCASTDLV